MARWAVFFFQSGYSQDECQARHRQGTFKAIGMTRLRLSHIYPEFEALTIKNKDTKARK